MNLKDMPDAQILALRESLAKDYKRHSAEATRISNILSKIKHELRLRRLERDGRPLVSDHALLRYLERVKGMDIESIRDDIQANLPQTGKGRNWKSIDCISQDGVRYYLSQDKRCITTVMVGENNDQTAPQVTQENN